MNDSGETERHWMTNWRAQQNLEDNAVDYVRV
jgi:hypothetical protein